MAAHDHDPHERGLLDTALAYAARGWRVAPLHTRTTIPAGEWDDTERHSCSCRRADCTSPAKHPRTKNGLKDATTDPDIIRGWWAQWPDANIGIRTGQISGIVVVDVDSYHGGDQGLAELEDEYGPLPATLTVDTGGGGRHLVYAHPGGDRELRNRAGLAPGVDTRGDGGYIVAAPSLHMSGRQYQWRRPLAPVAELPEWLSRPKYHAAPRHNGPLPKLEAGRDHPWVRAAWDAELAELGRSPQGTRNDQLNTAAFNLGQLVPHALTETEVEAALHDTALAIGLSDHEARGTIASGLAAGKTSPREIPERTLHVVGGRTRPRSLDPDTDDQPRDLLKRWTAAELIAADRTFSWLIKGWAAQPTFGMTAGEAKTLKTYLSTFAAIALSSGQKLFDHFEIPAARTVMYYVGEGGRIPYTNRFERIAWSMNLTPADLPFHATFETAPILSTVFIETLRRDLDELEPGLVTVDPFYAYHGTSSEAKNLHHEGALLTSLSEPCGEAGACLNIVNHWNKTGTGTGLDRITMSGGQEWADSWWLLTHRRPPNVADGQFQLRLDIGSRQWGGRTWDLDLNVGRFDIDTGEFNGRITWNVDAHRDGDESDQLAERAFEAITNKPGELTREEAATATGGRLVDARQAVARLERTNKVKPSLITRIGADGKHRRTWVLEPCPTAVPDTDADTPEEA